MAPNDSWLQRTTNAAAAGVGSFAGGIVTAVGNGIAGAGRGAGASVTTSSRHLADGVREYGNYIKDTTGASGARSSTATNPLGLSSTKQGARLQAGHTYSAPSNPLGLSGPKQGARKQITAKPSGRSPYGGPKSAYSGPRSTYGSAKSTYGAPRSTYGGAKSTYGGAKSTYGGAKSTYGGRPTSASNPLGL
ncbi:hypothetical protein GQ43DRAFT_460618 [Delitschia confertaspora ATCC 74209]|uniref:Uncharacterized protein n=1 Tax=Delitschia confertaspora ATCC 74209 TaxID=1513339 RepID=A0A9P4JWT8_9PLEO|nr:hypothetical protein GQ43DRAFT_460618 [Delitschia confertaspora ATCC 74209]